jgi:tRNA pseudouridine38-40 synthase
VRVKAVISYDGASFRGFQKQKSTNLTVTQAVEEALVSIGIKNSIRGGGRTDKGVHATGQVIDFIVPYFWRDLNRLRDILNRKLNGVYFKHISSVDSSFHARFSAKRRIYRYIFKTTKPSIFEERYISYYPNFNREILNRSLKLFEGEHDFGYFLKSGTVTNSNIRTIYRAYYMEYKKYHIIYFEANGFLRSQVRLMVDFAIKVSLKELTISQQLQQLELKKRYSTALAPPNGLYLARIIY